MYHYPIITKYHRERAITFSFNGVFLGAHVALVCAAFVALCFLYVVERNATMNTVRTVKQQSAILAAAQKETAQLEARAVALASHQNLKMVAAADDLITAPQVRYVAVGKDTAVAMTR